MSFSEYVPPKTNFSFTKKRMSNTFDDQMNLNLQPPNNIKENGFSHHPSLEISQNVLTAGEINKEMERNLEKFKTEEHNTKLKPQTPLKEYNSNIRVYKEWEIKNKFNKFFDNSMMLGDYKSEFENTQLNEKCFSDYKKVKENLISIDEFVSNLKSYKDENLKVIPQKTLPSIKAAIHEKSKDVLELPLQQLKISSNAYALNKEESEKIQKNLPLFYNLLFKNDSKEEKVTDDQKEESNDYTGTIKSK